MGGKQIIRLRECKKYQESEEIKELARGDKKNVFVRNRKLTLTALIIQIMTRTGLTAVMELIHYFKSKKMEEVSTQAYFKAKQNLNPEV